MKSPVVPAIVSMKTEDAHPIQPEFSIPPIGKNKDPKLILSVAIALSLLHIMIGMFPWPVFGQPGGYMGIFTHKSMLGQVGTVAAITAFALFLAGRDRHGILFPALALGLALTAVAISQSATNVFLAPAMLGLLALICIRRISAAVSLPLSFAVICVLALGPVILEIKGIEPVTTALDAVGKDTTLTGRTLLWQVAGDVVADNPLLGVGYGAFWASPDFLNQRLMTQDAGAITSTSFHNFYYEIRVAGGLMAVAAMLAVLVTAAIRLLVEMRRPGSVEAAGGLVLVAAAVLLSWFSPSLYRGHEFLLAVVVIYAVSAREGRPA